MNSFCYQDLKSYRWGGDYLDRSPRKSEALSSNVIEGKVTVLPNCTNRAITIETDEDIYLQSYDTLILKKNKRTGKVKKLWDGYSKTTLKHVNQFLGTYMGKYDWLEYGEEG